MSHTYERCRSVFTTLFIILYRHACPTVSNSLRRLVESLAGHMGPSARNFFHRFLQSPCQYLSVWSSGDSKQQKSCLFVSLYSADEAAVRYARAFLRAFVGQRLRAFFGRRSKLIRCDILQQPSGKKPHIYAVP